MEQRRFNIGDLPVRRRCIDGLLFSLLLTLAPHTQHLPAQISGFCLIFGIWRWLVSHRAWPLPGAVTRAILTIAALSGVYLSFGTLFGRDAGTALLSIMMGLKLLEVRRLRDANIAIFLGYFLATTYVLYSQEIVVLFYLLSVIWLLTTVLIDLNDFGRGIGLGQRLRYAGKILLQAVPLMVIIFILFPRIPGPLWQLPKDAHSGMTGLDDEMTPGSISQLGQSDITAFRARFAGATPDQAALYWRGPVLWDTDGKHWHGDKQHIAFRPDEGAGAPGESPVHYAVTLEPHNRKWLYALELPDAAAVHGFLTRDYVMVALKPVQTVIRYEMTAFPGRRIEQITPEQRRRALGMPPGRHPRARRLASAWLDAGLSDEEIVRRSLRYFREQPFEYTLQPPLLADDPIDEFLFDTRRGFCEHFAASFTILMRAAGVPARVVTGYQGGEPNPLGDYLIVRQRDAHAWAEVWLEGKGWVRVDPTAAVAPERINYGVDTALENEARDGLLGAMQNGPLSAMLRRMRFSLDLVNNQWNQWVLGYSPLVQSDLLSRLGIKSMFGMALSLVLAVLALVLLTAVVVLRRRRRHMDPLLGLYRRFCAKLAKHGVRRLPAEGPMAFAERAAILHPGLAPQIEMISRLYVAMRYGPTMVPNGMEQLKHDIDRFQP